MIRISVACLTVSVALFWVPAGSVDAQEPSEAQPADVAFEAGDWALAIEAYRELLVTDPDNGITWLRIAQAQRGLRQHERALETLERARDAEAPAAMIDLERARNLASVGQSALALGALEAADHLGLRALSSLDEAEEFASLRTDARFERVYRGVRNRIYPCEGLPTSSAFDFWLGDWDVRLADGTLVGHSTISKEDGGCSIVETWDGAGGSSGTSINYFLPSRKQWRQVWVGSGGTLIDMVGSPVADGMRLEGTIEYAGQDRVLAFRGTWTTVADGRVRQHLEEFNLVAQGWDTWFDGYYRLRAQP
ncbi:MAG: tetratricopeptide repeat protein [Gammaproteobacteria bacterium]